MTIKEMNARILEHYGAPNQFDKLCEELLEFVEAIGMVKSGSIRATDYRFLEEVADVKNMIQQVEISLPIEFHEDITLIQYAKADRQIGRIADENA